MLPIIMYHAVGEDSLGRFNIEIEAFKKQISYLANNYEVIRLKDIEIELRFQKNSDKKKIAITFDDAFMNVYQNAHKILEENNVPYTVFVPTGYIGKTCQWMGPQVKLMDVTMMNDLRKSGHVDFGSHSSHHLNMAATPDADMKEEIRQSKEKLEKILPGISVYMFAYPFGGFHDISNKAIKALLDVGFKIAVTTIPGTMNSPAQLLKLRRVQFTTDDSLSIIKAKLNGDYDWYIVKDKVMYYLRKMLKLKVR